MYCYDVIMDFPDCYMVDDEWRIIHSSLNNAEVKTTVNLLRDHPGSCSCFDNLLILLPPAVEILRNALIYPSMYEALKYAILFLVNHVKKARPAGNTSDRMPQITLITEKGTLHIPLPENVIQDFHCYMKVIEQCTASITSTGKSNDVEFILDVDTGYLNAKFRTLEEYGNKNSQL